MTRRQYKTPPIREALCEFRFAPGDDWDVTVIGKLHELVKGEYAGKARQQDQLTADLFVPHDGGAPSVAMNRSFERTQFPSADGRVLLAVGRDVLSLHGFAPYEGWESFRHRIQVGLQRYTQVAAPAGVHRIGVRYVNQIAVSDFEISRYFRCAPQGVDGLPVELRGFVQRSEYSYEDGVRLIVTFASIRPDEQDIQPTFLLDVDVLREFAEPLSIDNAMAAVDTLRDRERDTFEALITDQLREVFDA